MNYQMLGQEILVKLIDCIIQSRVDVKKTQIRKFHDVHRQIKQKHNQAFNGKRSMLLQNLIHVETLGLREKLNLHTNEHKIRILFSLFEIDTKKTTLTQIWTIYYDTYNQFQSENEESQFIMLARLMEELLFFLNQQPLFTEFYKSSISKEKFKIIYSIQKISDSSQKFTALDFMNHCYVRERISHSIYINVECSSLPRAHILQSMQLHSKSSKNPLSTIDASEKHISQIPAQKNQRKISLFQIHDEELDFVFLSSSDEELGEIKQKGKVKEVEIDDFCGQSQEFQMLIYSKDEQKYEELKEPLQELAALEKDYLFNQ